MPNDVQVNAADAAPYQTEFIVGLWGEVKQGTMQGGACRECHARLTGAASLSGAVEPLIPIARPVRYGPHNPAPSGIIGEDDNCNARFPICGICRQALYEGDGTIPIRLYPDDLELPSDVCSNLKGFLAAGDKQGALYICEMHDVPMPGVPSACPECVALYKPRILSRLKAQNLVPQEMTESRMSRAMLL